MLHTNNTMKKSALLMSLVVVSAIVGGSFAYGWHSVMSSPDGSAADSVTPATSESGDVTTNGAEPSQISRSTDSGSLSQSPSLEQQLAGVDRDNGQVRLTLDESQLNQLVSGAILSQPLAAQIFANAQPLQATLNGDSIEAGAVLNLSELPREGLPIDLQTGLDQLTNAAPMLANRDIYMGIVARPSVQDGKVSLDQDLSVRLGQFTLPMADVAEQMGLSTNEIEQRLNAIVMQQGLILENIEIADGLLIITGTKS